MENLKKSRTFHLIEVNLISAQDLKRSRMMQTYVVAWIDPERKLKSRIDVAGRENPTWNDKFVFLVDDQTLNGVNSSLVIEIYCVRRLRKDKRVGIVRVLLDNFVQGSNRYYEGGIRGTFRAFQVRCPSGEPQGMLNIGLIDLDGLCFRVMNEFAKLSSGIDHTRLMGGGKFESVERRGGFSKLDFGMRGGALCGVFPAKKILPSKVHQWPMGC